MAVKRSAESFGAIAAIDIADVLPHPGEVDRRPAGLDAERAGREGRVAAVAGGDQGLRRDAADIEAFAAHPAALDQHHRDPEGGRDGRDREAGRAGPDHAEVRRQRLATGCPSWVGSVLGEALEPAAIEPLNQHRDQTPRARAPRGPR